MLDIEYKLDKAFQSSGTILCIGGLGYDKLKNQDKDIFISDCIAHEFIHGLLEYIFNKTTSELFDFIGDSLLNKIILKKGVCLTPYDSLWSDAVLNNGIKYIYNEYMIDNTDLIQCYLICNTRIK